MPIEHGTNGLQPLFAQSLFSPEQVFFFEQEFSLWHVRSVTGLAGAW
jgi:hypothetical protein